MACVATVKTAEEGVRAVPPARGFTPAPRPNAPFNCHRAQHFGKKTSNEVISKMKARSVVTMTLVTMSLGTGLWVLKAVQAVAQSAPTPGLTPENAPLCFMLVPSGQLVDLNRLCYPQANSSQNSVRRTLGNLRYEGGSVAPAPNLGGLANRASSPSAPPCFGLDDQGRPCR